DGGAEAGRRRHERLRNAWRYHGEARRALRADAVKGIHDAHHGPEEADERARACRRREERQVTLELGDFQARRAAHGAVGRFQPLGARLLAVVHHALQFVAARQLLVRGEIELRERALSLWTAERARAPVCRAGAARAPGGPPDSRAPARPPAARAPLGPPAGAASARTTSGPWLSAERDAATTSGDGAGRTSSFVP